MQTFINKLKIILIFAVIALSPPALLAQLSGTYTIGSGGDYISFNAAVNALEAGGVSGAVTFQIQPGIYDEHLDIGAISGASADNTITFEGTTAEQCTLRYITSDPDSNYMVQLTNTQYMRFRNLTFLSAGSQYGRIFYLLQGVGNLEITDNIIQGVLASGAEVGRALIYSHDQWIDNILISGNEFHLGGWGIHLYGRSDNSITGIEITDNVFYDNAYRAIYTGYSVSPLIYGNTIHNGSGGIFLQQVYGEAQVYNNRVNVSHQGMEIRVESAVSGHSSIYNNFFDGSASIGIEVYDSKYIDIYNNSINLFSASPSPIATSSALNIYAGEGIDIKNNNLANQAGGYAMYINAESYRYDSDYNNLYSPGDYLAYAGGKCIDLAEYQSATGKDMNSISVYPHYLSGTDLHTVAPWLNGRGTPLAGITVDIDGDARSAFSPDIGADEFAPDPATTTPMAGSYTIGETEYPTIASAVADIELKGVSAPVTFNIVPGIYNEQVEMVSIAGASPQNRITFQSSSGNPADVNMAYGSGGVEDNYVFRLWGADNIEIKNMTLSGLETLYARVLELWGCADSILIQNNVFNGAPATDAQNRKSLIYAYQSNYRSRIIEGNSFKETAFSIYVYTSGTGYLGRNLNITDNVMNNDGYCGIYLGDNHSVTIENNDIRTGTYGIYIQGMDGVLSLATNHIDASMAGIYLNSCSDLLFTPGLICNNFVSVRNAAGSNAAGIRVSNSDYQNIFHNSFSLQNGSYNSAVLRVPFGSSHLVIMNNNFAQMDGGRVYDVPDAAAIEASDYNNLYTPGNQIAYWGDTRLLNLKDLQALTGMDQHSLAVYPHYLSSADLHTIAPWLDGKGTPLAAVPLDIDGQPRDADHPDIGADEFTADPATTTPLSGDYSVGSGDYPTIKAAVDDAVMKGVSGPVRFNIMPGTYSEQLDILSIAGTDSKNTVTFQSNSGSAEDVQINYGASDMDANYVLRVYGADFLHFENLTFNAEGDPYARIFHLYRGADSIEIRSNVLNGIVATGNDNRQAAIFSYESQYRSRIIEQNSFNQGTFGIFMTRENSSQGYPAGAEIFNNSFANIGYGGIHLQYYDAPKIMGNTIAAEQGGIYVSNIENDLRIEKNKLDIGTDNGIYMSNCSTNMIIPGLIANNFVHVGGIGPAVGLRIGTSDYQNIYNNSFNITSSDVTDGQAIYIYAGSHLNIENNIFANNGGGYAYYAYNPSGISISDYNDIYTTGTNLAYWNGNRADLAALRSESAMDDHSLSVDPRFISDADLHVRAAALDSAGTHVSGVTDDIDGDPRDPSFPDIGADEFDLSSLLDFADIHADIQGMFMGTVEWGDYDNDGDLDFVMAGRDSVNPVHPNAKIYRNDDGNFVDIDAGLLGIDGGTAAWADYDNDGDLDLLLSGDNPSHGLVTEIYRNDAGTFVNINADLVKIYNTAAAWGDYDNDGDLDLILSGQNYSTYFTILYQNNNGTFVNSGLSFTAVSSGSAAWADYDGDGDLDLLLCGWDGAARHTTLYRNEGGAFTALDAGLQGINTGDAAWGDYDSDGDPDLLLTGHTDAGQASRIYRNDDGIFNDAGAPLENLWHSSAEWGDYNNDGAIDIILTGTADSYVPYSPVSTIYRNETADFVDSEIALSRILQGRGAWGDYDNDNDLDILFSGADSLNHPVGAIYRNNAAQPNTPPSAPAGLTTMVTDSSVIFSWHPASDAQTPVAALTYNLRIGTTEGGSEVMSPMADNSGFRKIVAMGNVQQDTSWEIKGLTSGETYYWSVQAVDNSYIGSAFAPEETVTVTGIVSGDNTLPRTYALYQNFPNPFNPATTIAFDLPRTDRVVLTVYDVLGQQVETILDDQMPAGRHRVSWQAHDAASGIYFFVIRTDHFRAVKKMILMK
ncbi:MAG: FG-GAP-like repeat-containing protein [Calditrichia bacterium]